MNWLFSWKNELVYRIGVYAESLRNSAAAGMGSALIESKLALEEVDRLMEERGGKFPKRKLPV